MWKQIKRLTKLQLCNIWGLNQIRYGKDKKKRNRFLLQAIIMGVLSLGIAVYAGGITYAYILLGAGAIVFPFLVVAISLLILVFTIYKVSSTIFNPKTYAMLITLPISPTAIVISRFLGMYIPNLGISAVVMLPAMVIYGIFMKIGLVFYLLMIFGILLIPLFPITLATAVGATITAITSKMKHKNIMTIILILSLIIIIMAIPMWLSPHRNTLNSTFVITTKWIRETSMLLQGYLYSVYPIAKWFTVGITKVNLGTYVNFILFSIGTFVVMIAIVQSKFQAISSALYGRGTSNNYQLQELPSHSLMQALYRKEMRMFFSSPIYVINTAMGYILMVIFGIGMFFTGAKQMEEIARFIELPKIIPLVMAMLCSITTTTICSISIEGKYWWIIQHLPISSKQIINSKLLVNLTVAFPCYVVTQIFLFLTFDFSFMEMIWMLLIPLVYMIFTTVLGLLLNCKMPVFDWESETVAVKQGGALILTILIGVGSVLVPLFLTILCSPFSNIILASSALVIGGIANYLYIKIQKINIQLIQ